MKTVRGVVRPFVVLYPRVVRLVAAANGWRLARAFMRDAQVLVMDEPSAALDPLAERDMYQRFAELTAGKVTVLISHRLASCKIASRIIVLENGRIIEEGGHDALMAQNGRYAEMFNAQAEHYQHEAAAK